MLSKTLQLEIAMGKSKIEQCLYCHSWGHAFLGSSVNVLTNTFLAGYNHYVHHIHHIYHIYHAFPILIVHQI